MIEYTIYPDNGEPYDVSCKSRDVLQWERTHKGASMKRLAEDGRMTDMTALAYVACKRQGLFTGTEEEFFNSVDIKPMAEDDDESEESEEDPTA